MYYFCRKHVVFGKLAHGRDVLKRIENAGDEDGNPTVTVKVINCGEYSEGSNYGDTILDNLKFWSNMKHFCSLGTIQSRKFPFVLSF